MGGCAGGGGFAACKTCKFECFSSLTLALHVYCTVTVLFPKCSGKPMIPISLTTEYIKTLLQSVNYMKPDLRIRLLMIVYKAMVTIMPRHLLVGKSCFAWDNCRGRYDDDDDVCLDVVSKQCLMILLVGS